MKPDSTCSRRTFLRGAGYASVLSMLGRNGIALPSRWAEPMAGFAYVGSSVTSQIHVFEVQGDRWTLRQSIASRSPAFMAMDTRKRFLYVANDVDEHQGLPRGTVEAYKIDAQTGQLTLLNRQSLSLSGTRPQHLAVSPDGQNLVVAIYGGGAYNMLPIAPDGALGAVTGIRKEIGCGPHPEFQRSAHPHTVIFDKTGKYVLSSDQGCDRLKVFALHDGTLEFRNQLSFRQGSGPGHIVMHHDQLYVLNAEDGSITGYRFDSSLMSARETCGIAPALPRSKNIWSRGTLMMSPSGNFLYAAYSSQISASSIDPTNGTLSHCQTWSDGATVLHAMTSTPNGSSLLAVDRQQHRVVKIEIDRANGKLGKTLALASVIEPSSFGIKYM